MGIGWCRERKKKEKEEERQRKQEAEERARAEEAARKAAEEAAAAEAAAEARRLRQIEKKATQKERSRLRGLTSGMGASLCVLHLGMSACMFS
jgi:Flp pilus assembly protein TadB